MSNNGKGAVSDHHYLAQNMLAGRELWKDADVVLAVGTRFVMPLTMWGLDDELTIIQMDADPEEVGRNHTPNIGIVADAKRGLAQLAERAARHNGHRDSREEELRALKARIEDRMFEVQPQAAFAEAIRAELPEDGIFISEMTQVGYWSGLGFPVYRPRGFVTAGYQGTLGYGYATALGAQVANPSTRVISINGDGGFMYNVQELATAVLHKIPLTAIVFSDNAFGNVKRIQQESYGGRTIGSDLYNPDFVKLADAFGMLGLHAETPDELRGAIREAFKQDGPALIEVPVGPMPNPSRMMGWGAPAARSRKG
jgi:acetolactate synthase-1/2/3 large subunit